MIDLKPFCAGDYSGRAYLENPFILDGKTYAMDGRIIVRLDAAAAMDVPGSTLEIPQSITNVIFNDLPWHRCLSQPMDLPQFEYKTIPCEICK